MEYADFQPTYSIWQTYLAGLHDTDDGPAWTSHFYLTRDEARAGPPVVATFGCFSYPRLSEDRIRLHFQNADTAEHSSLEAACVGQRRADLTALFEHVQGTLPAHVRVVGISWLYNPEAYIYPKEERGVRDLLRKRKDGKYGLIMLRCLFISDRQKAYLSREMSIDERERGCPVLAGIGG